jgi:hypothetical protein
MKNVGVGRRGQLSARRGLDKRGQKSWKVRTVSERDGMADEGRSATLHVSIPSALVEEAKEKTGIRSNRKLVEAALARLVNSDGYIEWLLAQRGTVSKHVDLLF